MDNRWRRHSVSTVLALFCLSGLVPAGCGQPEPPPISAEALGEAKKNREEIIKKEYGGAASAPGKR